EFNSQLLNLEPGVAYPVKGNPRENFTEINVGSPDAAYYNEIAMMKDEMSLATGVGDQLFGVQPQRGKITAFEAALTQENALRRMSPWVKLMGQALERDAKLWFSLARQHYTNPIEWERINGMDPKPIY